MPSASVKAHTQVDAFKRGRGWVSAGNSLDFSGLASEKLEFLAQSGNMNRYYPRNYEWSHPRTNNVAGFAVIKTVNVANSRLS